MIASYDHESGKYVYRPVEEDMSSRSERAIRTIGRRRRRKQSDVKQMVALRGQKKRREEEQREQALREGEEEERELKIASDAAKKESGAVEQNKLEFALLWPSCCWDSALRSARQG